MTLNMMPMIWLCFVGDHKLIKTFQQLNRVVHKNSKLQAVREKFGGQSMGLAMGMEKAEHASRRTRHNAAAGGEEEGQRSKAFASLVGDAYSIDSRVEMFAFCDYLEQTFSGSPVNRSRRMRRIYVVALFVLALYALVAWFTVDEEWRTQPFLLIAGTVVTDSMMYLLRRGPCTWGPARYVTMLFAGRAAITAFCGPWWLVGFGLAYFIWGLSIAIEIISQRMRTMTDEQAGAVAYFGDNLEKEPHHDTAGAPEFVLGYLSFIFLMMLVAAIFGKLSLVDVAAYTQAGEQLAKRLLLEKSSVKALTFVKDLMRGLAPDMSGDQIQDLIKLLNVLKNTKTKRELGKKKKNKKKSKLKMSGKGGSMGGDLFHGMDAGGNYAAEDFDDGDFM